MRRPDHAVCSLAALDVRRRPDHRAELTSQLLLGEVVRILARGRCGLWWRVESLTDGYRGWARSWGLVPASRARALGWARKARTRVSAPLALATARPGGGALVSPLFLNSRLIAGPRRGRHRRVELPDGRRGWVEATALAGPAAAVPLLARVLSLMGVPYLWGGRTPAGFDCSGFTQQVLAERGIRLPRDAARQRSVSARLRRGERPRPGDLVFFAGPRGTGRHVGIGLGGGYFAHCRGYVRISSLDQNNQLCDKDLLPQFKGWGRPPKAGGRRG